LAQPSRFCGEEMFKSQNDESMAVLSLAIDDVVRDNNNEEVLFC